MGEFHTGDTGPDISAIIHVDGDAGDIEPLTDCTVRFQMRAENDKSYRVNGLAQIVDALLGKVRYAWAANDLNLRGTYLAQWEITYPGGKVVTTRAHEVIVTRQ